MSKNSFIGFGEVGTGQLHQRARHAHHAILSGCKSTTAGLRSTNECDFFLSHNLRYSATVLQFENKQSHPNPSLWKFMSKKKNLVVWIYIRIFAVDIKYKSICKNGTYF